MPLFKKCDEFTTAKELIEKDIYPYFHELQSRQDIEVMMEGKRRIMLGSNNYLGLTAHPDVIQAGADYLAFYRFDMLLYALAFCVLSYINGTGRTRYTMFVNIFTSFAVRVPLVWMFSRIAGATLYHIGLAAPIASVIQLLMAFGFVFLAKSEREHRKAELQK